MPHYLVLSWICLDAFLTPDLSTSTTTTLNNETQPQITRAFRSVQCVLRRDKRGVYYEAAIPNSFPGADKYADILLADMLRSVDPLKLIMAGKFPAMLAISDGIGFSS